MNEQKIAELVRHYIKDCRPHGMTIEVIEQSIRKGKTWWDVPIRLNIDPPKLYELDQALNKVQIELEDRENITVFLEPIYPKSDNPSEPEPPPKPRKRRGQATKKMVAEVAREYLKDCHPGGVTIEVVEKDIYKSYYEWRVPIQPNFGPPNDLEFSEAIIDVAIELNNST